MGHAWEEEDADAAVEELGDEGAVAGGHDGHVVVFREDDADVCAAVAGGDESAEDAGVGKVGVFDPDPVAGVVEGMHLGAEERRVEGASGERADGDCACGDGDVVEGLAADLVPESGGIAGPAGVCPCVLEGILHAADERAFDADHHVVPFAAVFAADVHAAGPCFAAVDDEEFGVIGAEACHGHGACGDIRAAGEPCGHVRWAVVGAGFGDAGIGSAGLP